MVLPPLIMMYTQINFNKRSLFIFICSSYFAKYCIFMEKVVSPMFRGAPNLVGPALSSLQCIICFLKLGICAVWVKVIKRTRIRCR